LAYQRESKALFAILFQRGNVLLWELATFAVPAVGRFWFFGLALARGM
jgi:hypothetical protein